MEHVPEPQFRASWRSIAVAALVVSCAALSGLIVAVSITGADVLSIVALVLAVLAFVIQIVVYIVQAADSASATRRSLALHSELSGMLSELRERTGITQKSVETINLRLLEAIIGKSGVAVGSADATQLASEIAQSYGAAATNSSDVRSARTGSPSDWLAASVETPPLPPDEAARIQSFLDEWPSATEADETRQAFNDLSAKDLAHLARLAADLRRFTKPGTFSGPGLGTLGAEGLVAAGLAEPMESSDWMPVLRLTEAGMRLARLFTARGQIPEWLSDLASIRDAAFSGLSNTSRDNLDLSH